MRWPEIKVFFNCNEPVIIKYNRTKKQHQHLFELTRFASSWGNRVDRDRVQLCIMLHSSVNISMKCLFILSSFFMIIYIRSHRSLFHYLLWFMWLETSPSAYYMLSIFTEKTYFLCTSCYEYVYPLSNKHSPYWTKCILCNTIWVRSLDSLPILNWNVCKYIHKPNQLHDNHAARCTTTYIYIVIVKTY